VTTEDLIIQLAGSAGPVQPIAPLSRRLGLWTAAAACVTGVSVALIGSRPDSWTMVHQTTSLAVVAVTMATALISAGTALVLSVPGAERSAVQRWAPIAACGAWIALLAVSILSGGSAIDRIVALPFHSGCAIQIAALGLLPGWMLFAMLRRAAPLRRHWSGGLATLAAVALAAVGTQFLCPLDDPAHLLVGHFAPVVALALAGALMGAHAFEAPGSGALRRAWGHK
jgi:hypothetical protein